MDEESRIQLTPLDLESAQAAIEAVDAIHARGLIFTDGLKNKETLDAILNEAFVAIGEVITSRCAGERHPTNYDAIATIFRIQDSLDQEDKRNSNDAIAYSALFDFIKSARIVAFLSAEILRNRSAGDLRDWAMQAAELPRER